MNVGERVGGLVGGDMFINIRIDHIHNKGSWLSQDIAPDF